VIEYQWYAVRDGQNQRKVFGFIKLAVNVRDYRLPIRRGLAVAAVIGDAQPRAVQITAGVDFIDLQIEFMGEGPTRERCIRSDDRTIAFWRTVSGFLEAQITEAPPPQRAVKKPKARKLPMLEIDL